MPSITCVPDVVTFSPGTCSRRTAPAITERAAFPVQSVTTCRSGIAGTITAEPNRSRDVPYKLVLLRHGQSAWNLENLFTGWIDVRPDRAGRGRSAPGRRRISLAPASLPDILHTSLQVRAIRTAELALHECGRSWIPGAAVVAVERTALRRAPGQGQEGDRRAVRRRQGEGVAPLLRRPPPDRSPIDDPSSGIDERYAALAARRAAALGVLEGRARTHAAVVVRRIVPDLRAGATVLVAAHGNSLRALVKHLDGMTPEAVVELNLPTGEPLVYELDDDLRPLTAVGPGGVRGRYLDPDRAVAGADAVAHQAG